MPGGVEPSNLDKVFWPDDGLTKGDLLAYFDAVAPSLLPALRGRPLTVVRYPNGLMGDSFYQKDTPKYAPPWVRTATVHAASAKRDVRYTVCGSKRTLLWLANQAAIELHPWLSRTDAFDRPTHLVLDIDPPEEGFDRAVRVALSAREVLQERGIASVAKTSGSKGVHVVVPLRRTRTFGQVRAAAEALAAAIVERLPDETTTEFRKAGRDGKVFLDTGRIAPGAHVASVFSPRARAGAPVSFPVPWDELRRAAPTDFTIRTVPDLLRRGDPWVELMPPPQTLPSSLVGG